MPWVFLPEHAEISMVEVFSLIRIPPRLLGSALMVSQSLGAAENYSTWSHGADLVVNTSASGAQVAGDVIEFPMLVRLTAANFPFSQARGLGQDVRFSNADGAPLSYEIERWDSARAVAEVWVKADTIRGNTSAQIFRMHWGQPFAADSSDAAAVFGAGNGFVAAWHLTGTDAKPRPNAVAGGNPATPAGYDGDENAAGIIAGADSLDGVAPDDHLRLGSGYADFSAGFTFSVWAYPTGVRIWSRLLDLGNGENMDNILLTLSGTSFSTGLSFHTYNNDKTVFTSPNQWALDRWQHFAVTVSGRSVRMYKDGVQVFADIMGSTLSTAFRNSNYLGKSNWASDEYFQGKLDQAELSRTARSADWIKLSHQNQKSGQNLVTLIRSSQCQTRFSAPRDTVAVEGSTVSLVADVECASGFFWSGISGPVGRILDPEVKILEVPVPRVAGDTFMVYRFSASFADSLRTRDVRISIRETVPEPVFTLASAAWNGSDSLALKPAISNLAAIRTSPDSLLHWAWTLAGAEVDTALLGDGLLLRGPAAAGELRVTLCLDNDGPKVCRAAAVTMDPATVAIRSRRPPGAASAPPPWESRDAAGRASRDEVRLRAGETRPDSRDARDYRPDRFHR